MCGIAGIIYRNGNGAHRIGRDITSMLQAMKHRGPDSTGFALYHSPGPDLVMRIKLADANTPRDLEFADNLRRHQGPGRSEEVAGSAHEHQHEHRVARGPQRLRQGDRPQSAPGAQADIGDPCRGKQKQARDGHGGASIAAGQ